MFKNASKNQARRGAKRSRLGNALGKKKRKQKAGPPDQVAELADAARRMATVKVKVVGFNTGGLIMRFKNVRVFCPISHVGARQMTPPGEFDGESWEVMVLSANANNVVVSRKHAEARNGEDPDAAA